MPPTPSLRKSGGSRWVDLLATAALAGCIVAICVRIATLEQRLLRLETKAPSKRPTTMPSEHAFRPIREDEEEENEEDFQGGISYQPMGQRRAPTKEQGEEEEEDHSSERIVEITKARTTQEEAEAEAEAEEDEDDEAPPSE